MPIANGFLDRSQFAEERHAELAVGFCARCGMVQLAGEVAREKMFHDNYAFFSSTSAAMAAHFRRFAEEVLAARLAGRDAFVVELGSNDGILLRHFARAGIRHLGVEPSANVAQAARSRGVRTVVEFFDEELARGIVAEHGQADAVLGANVMCHLPYLHSVASGVRLLLKPRGVLVFEDPYLGDMIEKTSYDQIYDEHAFYFSVTALERLFGEHGMEIVDVAPQKVHGGSMRYTVAHRGAHARSAAVDRQVARERELGLGEPATFERFRRSVEASRDELTRLLRRLKAEGRRVAGLRRHLEEYDGHELLRHHAGARRVHLRHHARQAGAVQSGHAHSGAAARRIRAAPARLRTAVRLEPCRGDHGQGARLHGGRRQVDSLRAARRGHVLMRALAPSDSFKPTWEGIYAHRRDVPTDGSSYDDASRVAEVARFTAAALQKQRAGRDPALWHDALARLAGEIAAARGTVEVLDFGGGVGTAYVQLLAALPPGTRIRHCIVDQPRMCAAGRRLFESDAQISFHEMLPEGIAPDIVYANSVLPYVDDYAALLRQLASRGAQFLLLGRFAGGSYPTYATRQLNLSGQVLGYWFHNSAEVKGILREAGYGLADESLTGPEYDQRNFPESHRVGRMQNLLFVRTPDGA